MSFYAPILDEERTLQQGDILRGIPFARFSLSQARVRRSEGGWITRNLTEIDEPLVAVQADIKIGYGLVLSQTCDLQADQRGAARKAILIARIAPLDELVAPSGTSDKARKNDWKRLINPGTAPVLFPLLPEPTTQFARSAASLMEVQTVPPSDLSVLNSLLHLRLSTEALQALQERCAYCFGRFAAPDDLYYTPEEWAAQTA